MNEEEKLSPLVSIVVVNHNTRQDLMECLASIKKNVNIPHEIIVTDNNSQDDSLEILRREYPEVTINSLAENVGYARANNIGAARASGKYLLILNPDTIVPPETVEHLVTIKNEHPAYGIVAPLILNSDLSFQISFGRDLGLFMEIFFKYFAEKYYGWKFRRKKDDMAGLKHWVSGACFLIERQLFNRLQGFDENYFIYIEDADLGKRVRKMGYGVYYSTAVNIIHCLGNTCSKIPSLILPRAKKSHLYYYLKHHGRVRMEILRIYLICRFQIKSLISRLKGERKSRQVYLKTLRFIKEFTVEDYS